jgi:hypothetical protein
MISGVARSVCARSSPGAANDPRGSELEAFAPMSSSSTPSPPINDGTQGRGDGMGVPGGTGIPQVLSVPWDPMTNQAYCLQARLPHDWVDSANRARPAGCAPEPILLCRRPSEIGGNGTIAGGIQPFKTAFPPRGPGWTQTCPISNRLLDCQRGDVLKWTRDLGRSRPCPVQERVFAEHLIQGGRRLSG